MRLDSLFWPFRRLRDINRRFWRRNQLGERLWLLFRLVGLLASPSYSTARMAVRSVAIEPRMRDWHREGPTWAPHLGQPGLQENLSRHFLASERFGPIPFSQRHGRNLLMELAYFALKERGK